MVVFMWFVLVIFVFIRILNLRVLRIMLRNFVMIIKVKNVGLEINKLIWVRNYVINLMDLLIYVNLLEGIIFMDREFFFIFCNVVVCMYFFNI